MYFLFIRELHGEMVWPLLLDKHYQNVALVLNNIFFFLHVWSEGHSYHHLNLANRNYHIQSFALTFYPQDVLCLANTILYIHCSVNEVIAMIQTVGRRNDCDRQVAVTYDSGTTTHVTSVSYPCSYLRRSAHSHIRRSAHSHTASTQYNWTALN